MKPKRRIQLMILAAIVFGGLAWLMIYTPDKPDIAETIRIQGTNAVPQLLAMLRAKDSKFKTKLIELSKKQNLVTIHFYTASDSYKRAVGGFKILGTNAGFAAPALIKIFEDNISEDSRDAVSYALMAIGPSGAEAVFYCFDHQGKTNAEFRAWVIELLSYADFEPKRLVPLLIQALKDPDPNVRWQAAHGLLNMVYDHLGEPDVRSAIPALTEALNDSDSQVRKEAAQTLNQLQPAAPAKTDEKQK